MFRNEDRIETAIQTMGYALLSDSKTIIDRYSNIKTQGLAWIGSIYIDAIQSVLKDDYERLDYCLSRFHKIFAKNIEKSFIGCLSFFNGIKQGNKEEIEAGLKELLKSYKKRGVLPKYQAYISIDTTTLAKLAWLKGIQVEIDSSLVPKELLPIRPLEKYEDRYDFLKEV